MKRSLIDWNDIVALLGLASLLYGLSLIDLAWVFVAVGVMLLAAGAAGARGSSKS